MQTIRTNIKKDNASHPFVIIGNHIINDVLNADEAGKQTKKNKKNSTLLPYHIKEKHQLTDDELMDANEQGHIL